MWIYYCIHVGMICDIQLDGWNVIVLDWDFYVLGKDLFGKGDDVKIKKKKSDSFVLVFFFCFFFFRNLSV